MRHDDAGRASADRTEQDPPAVEIDRTYSTCRNNLMIDQAAIGIEKQGNQKLVAAEPDQMLEQVGGIERGMDRSALVQLVLKRPGHKIARANQCRGRRSVRIVADDYRIGAQQFR